MKKYIWEIWKIANANDMTVDNAANMMMVNIAIGEAKYPGADELDYSAIPQFTKEELRKYDNLLKV